MSAQQTMTFTETEGAGLTDWRWLLGSLHAHFNSGDFATGLTFVNRIGELAEVANHHPDVDLRYPYVRVTLMSHDAGGVTSRDIDLARGISGVAAGSTSTSSSRPSRRSAGSRPRWGRAARWSPTTARRRSRCSRTPRGTRPASAHRLGATEAHASVSSGERDRRSR
jgi:pterin-4a-carbinolamine dehydratase